MGSFIAMLPQLILEGFFNSCKEYQLVSSPMIVAIITYE